MYTYNQVCHAVVSNLKSVQKRLLKRRCFPFRLLLLFIQSWDFFTLTLVDSFLYIVVAGPKMDFSNACGKNN